MGPSLRSSIIASVSSVCAARALHAQRITYAKKPKDLAQEDSGVHLDRNKLHSFLSNVCSTTLELEPGRGRAKQRLLRVLFSISLGEVSPNARLLRPLPSTFAVKLHNAYSGQTRIVLQGNHHFLQKSTVKSLCRPALQLPSRSEKVTRDLKRVKSVLRSKWTVRAARSLYPSLSLTRLTPFLRRAIGALTITVVVLPARFSFALALMLFTGSDDSLCGISLS